MPYVIKQVLAKELLDSRGYPALEVTLSLNYTTCTAMVPAGASVGSLEARELRDGGARYQGMGLLKAVSNVNTRIAAYLIGKTFANSQELDHALIELDGTANKANLGANAILAVSLAFAKCCAKQNELTLYEYINASYTELYPPQALSMPAPMLNILNGGAHANNKVDIQEFMVMPLAANISESIRWGVEIYHALKNILRTKGLSTTVGDEGGFAPDLKFNQQALDLLLEAIELTGLKVAKDVVLAIDVAASELYTQQQYNLSSENKTLSSEELIQYLLNLLKNYPIYSVEDPLAEQDWLSWQSFTKQASKLTREIGIQIVGDDIFVTNPQIFSQGINQQIANAILIKPNQIGTLTEVYQTVCLAKENNYNTVISHRSGETEDTSIVDLAIGLNAGQIKTGAPARVDRVAKYNELLRIYAKQPNIKLTNPSVLLF